MNRCFALIPAAGTGTRMGGTVAKQYLDLGGAPMIAHSMMALARSDRIERIFVVLAPEDQTWDAYDWAGWDERIQVLRCGGATRAETVRNGLAAMAPECAPDDWVLVHDAARPCLSDELLDRLIETLCTDPVGGLLAVPVADTLKRADPDTRVSATVPRVGLWQAQTPQMFRHAQLTQALEAAGAGVTDEASAIEMLGLAPRLVASDSTNLKVTWPQDRDLATLILKSQNAWNPA